MKCHLVNLIERIKCFSENVNFALAHTFITVLNLALLLQIMGSRGISSRIV